VVRAFRHHSRETNGRQGKGARVIDPYHRANMATGDREGGRHLVIVLVSRRYSNSPSWVNVDGVRVRQISSLRILPIHRPLVVVVVMTVVIRVVIPTFIEIMLYLSRPHQPWVVMCVVSEVVIPTAMNDRPPSPTAPPQPGSVTGIVNPRQTASGVCNRAT